MEKQSLATLRPTQPVAGEIRHVLQSCDFLASEASGMRLCADRKHNKLIKKHRSFEGLMRPLKNKKRWWSRRDKEEAPDTRIYSIGTVTNSETKLPTLGSRTRSSPSPSLSRSSGSSRASTERALSLSVSEEALGTKAMSGRRPQKSILRVGVKRNWDS